jgi:histidine triad (HIT) family protein
MSENCIFCKIANHEISDNIIYENRDTVAFLDIHPRSPGHTVIIPKEHAANVLELSEESAGAIFLTIKEITGILDRALSPDGFTTGINHDEAFGQTINHLHIHIFPRYKGDNGSSIHSVVNNPPTESLEEIKEKIKSIN